MTKIKEIDFDGFIDILDGCFYGNCKENKNYLQSFENQLVKTYCITDCLPKEIYSDVDSGVETQAELMRMCTEGLEVHFLEKVYKELKETLREQSLLEED